MDFPGLIFFCWEDKRARNFFKTYLPKSYFNFLVLLATRTITVLQITTI